MSEYDPTKDESLRCHCQGDEDYGDGGWPTFFHEVIVPQQIDVGMTEMKELNCPRTMVRHAAARLAVAIAMLDPAVNDSDSAQHMETIMEDLPNMLRPMIDDAVREIKMRDKEEESRGEAAGFKKVPTGRRLN